jgi:hypothetical protein
MTKEELYLCIPKETHPDDPNCLDPNMTLMCLWCWKDFSPYNYMILHDHAWMGFCSDEHFILYKKYGKIKEFFENIVRYIYWKPKHVILDWWYQKDCPYCHKRMFSPLAGEVYCCMECGRDFEVVTQDYRITVSGSWNVGAGTLTTTGNRSKIHVNCLRKIRNLLQRR